eukprot:GHRQ01036149.1.p1 GENE.GHRQ01036149.1~~GHRQ01036149.1.p1  ORF type:complete len:133 (-),score=44.12 GHRQ01036149.1:242-640(-)
MHGHATAPVPARACVGVIAAPLPHASLHPRTCTLSWIVLSVDISPPLRATSRATAALGVPRLCSPLMQMIFLNSLFGYLCNAIVYKWLTAKTTDLYHVMIYMFLSPGTVDEAGYLFPGQAGLQVRLRRWVPA